MAKTLGDFIREARAQIEEWDAETAHERMEEGGVLVRHEYEMRKTAAGTSKKGGSNEIDPWNI